ncbi:hypothetical protein EDD16DRAFT_1528182 [Pisolithus croceorrhizus]|nr:hypothetical protein EDD16DRAFT_1528182 [Pisolithus croceorrhizus]
MEEGFGWFQAPPKSHPELLGQAQDLLGYLEEVVEYGKAQGIMDTLSLVQIAIDGAPPLTGKLWHFLVVNTPVLEQWDSFEALITLQYLEIKPAKDILEHFEEFYSYLDEACHMQCLGDEPSAPAVPLWSPTTGQVQSLEEARLCIPPV